MPVDTTRIISTRRTQKQITEEELRDIELKRLRGELSCAECRRLKLRCDKKVPCGSCCRRGCESICPCGQDHLHPISCILSAGQGTRFILADTEQLHRKISEMSNRIRQLEDALAILQATLCDERHPLLDDEHLKVKFGSESLDARKDTNDDTDTRQSIDALGTLTLGKTGEMHYFGRSAGSETLMMAEDGDTDVDDDDGETPIPLAPELDYLANMLPFFSKRRPNASSLELLESFLPAHERAFSLCESYLNHATFFFRPIKRDELLEKLMPSIYKTAFLRVQERIASNNSPKSDQTDDEAYVDLCTPHSLATLFFLFALGALLDLKLLPYNAEAEHFYDLGRAALALRPVCGSPSLETVQAVGLMATYHSLAGKKYSRDSAWCIMSLAAKLAQSFGLHRDSSRWNMDAATVQRRRNLFWEVFAADISHSLALGRPPAIHLSYVDCEFPEDKEATLDDSGEIQSGFWGMKHNYARNIFNSVAEATLSAQAPTYKMILDLDRRVREMHFPTSLKPYVSREDGDESYYSGSLSLRDFYASQHRTVTMLYLHRSFFAQAMLDHPANPLRSPFAPSFLTAYRCATIIIKASAHHFDRCAHLAMRIWFLLYHTFSAAVIVGTIVTRSPKFNMAPGALDDLNIAVRLFERTAVQSQRAKVALGVLRRLQNKAIRAYSNAMSLDSGLSVMPSGDTSNNDVEDELAIFGGQARILTWKAKNKSDYYNQSASPRSGQDEIKQEVNSFGNDNSNRTYETMLAPQSQLSAQLPQRMPRQSASPAGMNPHTFDAHPSATQMGVSGDNTPMISDSNIQSAQQTRPEYSNKMDFISSNPFEVLVSSSVVDSSSSIFSTQHHPAQAFQLTPNMEAAWSQWVQTATPSESTGFPSLLDDQSRVSKDWIPSDHPPLQTTQVVPSDLGYTAAPNPGVPAYLGSDTGGKYLIQENAALLASYRLMPQTADASDPNYGYRRDESPQAMNPAGAVELGLSGESWLDAGWIELMRDCGVVRNSSPE